ncbi:MAG: hypothetical protein IT578_08530 [Verrucomicrobiae bacterium]|nr:hypothetical protein [Verrucomicrobiae bacterium]
MKTPVRGAVLALALAAQFAFAGDWEWSGPVRLATASCSRFSWVSDLPMAPETGRLLEHFAVDVLRLPGSGIHRWDNGSAEDFIRWLEELSRNGDPQTTLILWFSTHQKEDGRMKFSEGPDLAPSDLVAALNRVAASYARLLFMNDSCHAAALERVRGFRENVVRLHASREREEAADVEFSKAPFGVERFSREARADLRGKMRWDPPGMTLMGLFLLEGGRRAARDASSVDLQELVAAMNASRDRFEAEVRQARPQRLVLAPADANFELVRRKP